MFVFGEYVGSLIVGDNVKTPFSVIDGKSGMAEAELIILFGQLGKDGLQVKCISRSGAFVKEVFFFFFSNRARIMPSISASVGRSACLSPAERISSSARKEIWISG